MVVQSCVFSSLSPFVHHLADTLNIASFLLLKGDAPVELPQRVEHLPGPPSGQPQGGHRRHAPGVVRVHRSEPAVTRRCCDPLWGHGRTRHALRTDHGRPPALQSFFCFYRSAFFFPFPHGSQSNASHTQRCPPPSQHPCATSRTTDPTPLPSASPTSRKRSRTGPPPSPISILLISYPLPTSFHPCSSLSALCLVSSVLAFAGRFPRGISPVHSFSNPTPRLSFKTQPTHTLVFPHVHFLRHNTPSFLPLWLCTSVRRRSSSVSL